MLIRPVRFGVYAVVLLALAALSCVPARQPEYEDHLPWMNSFSAAQEAAKAAKKPMVVDFWATWCGPCHLLAERSFPHEKVQSLKNDFIWAKLDVDRDRSTAAKYKIRALPTIFVLDSNGQVISDHEGYMDGASLALFLQEGLTKSRIFKPGT